jgi:hypothetical protein
MSGQAKVGLAAALLMAATALASGCLTRIEGRPTAAPVSPTEPTVPTTRPPRSPNPTTASPQSPAPTIALPAPSSAPPGVVTLEPNEQGYVFIETKSGKTRCQISAKEADCEAQFTSSPVMEGTHANGVSVTAAGAVRWVVGNLGDIPVITLDYQTYRAQGWTIAADSNGTRFTNDRTGHGMFVSIDRVEPF